jgi:GT2 family glycosyltransferase
MSDPLVSIVIPTYNRKKLAERAINSLLNNSYKNLEIIAVDDASSDNTSEYLNKKFRANNRVKVYKNKKNLFAAGTKNVGQEKIKGKYLQFFDDDNVADKNMIRELVSVLENNPDIGEVGPVNYNFNNKNIILLSRSTRNMWTTKTHHLRNLVPFGSKTTWATDDVANSFMVRSEIVRKNKIEFKAKFGIMYEESDYAYRIRKLGYRIVFVRKAKIYHDIEDLSSKKNKKDYLYHFMQDTRRPFVFARNRVIFHSLYSTSVQKLFIYSFWVWFFTIYYCYKFIFYNGFGHFSFTQRMSGAFNYFRGTFNGLYVVAFNKMSDFK